MENRAITPDWDPWDPLLSLNRNGRHVLTSVELTVTNLCNMRCEHCAVGDTLTEREGEKLPLKTIFAALDKVDQLETISITGGEPSYSSRTVSDYLVPILQYAKERNIKTQLNSNVTLDLSRYEQMAPYLDVLHISFNYLNADDFHAVGFSRSGHSVGKAAAERLYGQMVNNTRELSRQGLFVSAESMVNYRTWDKIADIHRLIAEMGCRRHEVHPMYPSAFASHLPSLSLDMMRDAYHRLLDERDPAVWLLFGTLPFFACSGLEEDLSLIRRLHAEPNVTVRNDPDGRNRLNVDVFTGEIRVTDFADVPPLGNIKEDTLDSVFARWLEHPLNLTVDCRCPGARCCGPNLLVANLYYPEAGFVSGRAKITL